MIPDSPPPFITPEELSEVLAELSRREPIFHRPEFGTTRAAFETMTVDDFWEVGASGRRYSRIAVLDELERRHSTPHPDVWQTSDCHCRKLAENVYLLTYTLVQYTLVQSALVQSTLVQDDKRRTRRSTIWERTAEGWKIIYHQGTLVVDE